METEASAHEEQGSWGERNAVWVLTGTPIPPPPLTKSGLTAALDLFKMMILVLNLVGVGVNHLQSNFP